MKTIAINGASGRIGSAVVKSLESEYNIKIVGNRLPDIHGVLAEIDYCDVFINNVMYEYSQVELLIQLYDKWKSKDKHIINIGSRAAAPNVSPGYKYSTVKAALNHFSDLVRYKDDEKVCKVTTINPGLVGQFDDIALQPEKVAETIKWVIEQPADVEISRIDLQHTAPYNYIQNEKAKRRGNKC